MGQSFLFALTAAFNPTLLAATTVMLVLDNPRRLLLGYLCGAMLTSVTLGLLIVFSLGTSSSTSSTARHQMSPAVDLAVGLLILTIVFVVGTGRDTRRRARSARKKAAKADKPPPKWQQALSGGSARTTFLVGALLTLPGASYLAGLREIDQQNLATPLTVLSVVGFNVIMLMLLEIPLLGYTVSPQKTAVAVKRFSEGLSRNGGRIGLIIFTVFGLALVVRGIVESIT